MSCADLFFFVKLWLVSNKDIVSISVDIFKDVFLGVGPWSLDQLEENRL